MRTVAIIPAGGSGRRMGSDVPKQYLMLGGMPILVHTLNIFQKSSLVDNIILVLPGGDVEKAWHEIVDKHRLSKIAQIVPGGKCRQDSVRNGLTDVGPDYDIVVIHDAVRPFVSQELLETAIAEVSETGAVTFGVPAKDTMKTVDAFGFVMETLVRDQIWLTQTPQVFTTSLIKEAYKKSYEDQYIGTDDASLVERLGVKVKMLPGIYYNIKITTAQDLKLGEIILSLY